MKKENKLDILLHGVGGVAVVFTCVVLFNIVSAQVKFRADFTEGKVFTLSEGTRNILKDLSIITRLGKDSGLSVKAADAALGVYQGLVDAGMSESDMTAACRCVNGEVES